MTPKSVLPNGLALNGAAARLKYGPYPKYHSLGIEWLGQTPAHWKIDRLKWSVWGCQNGVWGDEPDGENDVHCVRVADFKTESASTGTNYRRFGNAPP